MSQTRERARERERDAHTYTHTHTKRDRESWARPRGRGRGGRRRRSTRFGRDAALLLTTTTNESIISSTHAVRRGHGSSLSSSRQVVLLCIAASAGWCAFGPGLSLLHAPLYILHLTRIFFSQLPHPLSLRTPSHGSTRGRSKCGSHLHATFISPSLPRTKAHTPTDPSRSHSSSQRGNQHPGPRARRRGCVIPHPWQPSWTTGWG